MNSLKNKFQQFESTHTSGLDKNKNWNNIQNLIHSEKKRQNKQYLYFGILVLCSFISFMFGYRMGVDHHQTMPEQQLPKRQDRINIQERTVVKTDTLFVTIKEESSDLITLKKVQIPKTETFETMVPTFVTNYKSDTLANNNTTLQTQPKIYPKDSTIQVVGAEIIPTITGRRTQKTYSLPVFISDTTKVKEVRTKWMWSSQGLIYSSSVKRQ